MVQAVRKSLSRRCLNRVLNCLSRISPGATTVRPWLHRARGMRVGKDVFIGADVYFDNEYPDAIEIEDGVQISIRAVIIAHTRGPGKVILGKEAFIGPHTVIAGTAGRVLTIGTGAVVSAGCIVTKNVPAGAVLVAAAAHVVGHATVPLTTAKTMQEYVSGLRPLRQSSNSGGTAPVREIPATNGRK